MTTNLTGTWISIGKTARPLYEASNRFRRFIIADAKTRVPVDRAARAKMKIQAPHKDVWGLKLKNIIG